MGGGNKRDDRMQQRKRNGDKIGRNGSEGEEEEKDAHLLILQAPQAENCSRVVFGWDSDF